MVQRWNAACERVSDDPSRCPDPEGPDYALWSGPNIVGKLSDSRRKAECLGAECQHRREQKMERTIGPEAAGEFMGRRTTAHLYTQAQFEQDFYKVDLRGRSHLGFWSAVEASTARILWQVPDPTAGTMDEGLEVATGVLRGIVDATGHVYA